MAQQQIISALSSAAMTAGIAKQATEPAAQAAQEQRKQLEGYETALKQSDAEVRKLKAAIVSGSRTDMAKAAMALKRAQQIASDQAKQYNDFAAKLQTSYHGVRIKPGMTEDDKKAIKAQSGQDIEVPNKVDINPLTFGPRRFVK